MNKYKCQFLGRESGAIGITTYCEKLIEAETADKAHFKLYDTHENIMKFNIVNLKDEKDYKSSKMIH